MNNNTDRIDFIPVSYGLLQHDFAVIDVPENKIYARRFDQFNTRGAFDEKNKQYKYPRISLFLTLDSYNGQSQQDVETVLQLYDISRYDSMLKNDLFQIMRISCNVGEKIRRKQIANGVNQIEILEDYLEEKLEEKLEKNDLRMGYESITEVVGEERTNELINYCACIGAELSNILVHEYYTNAEKMFNIFIKN